MRETPARHTTIRGRVRLGVWGGASSAGEIRRAEEQPADEGDSGQGEAVLVKQQRVGVVEKPGQKIRCKYNEIDVKWMSKYQN